MLNKIDEILTQIRTVPAFKYVSDNQHEEINDYPAAVLEDEINIDLEKLAVNGQIYNGKMSFTLWLHFPVEWSRDQIATEFDLIVKALTTVSGVNYIKILRLRRTFWQIGSIKTRSVSATIEFLTREAWV